MKNVSIGYAIFCTWMVIVNVASGQVPRKYFNPDSLDNNYYGTLRKEFGNYKKIPAIYEKPLLIALSYYPELRNTPIRFRVRKRHSIAQTRCSWTGLFKRKELRDYVITISDQTELLLTPLLFKNISFNAQIGVAGHELAHVLDFSGYSFLRIIVHGIRNTSPTYLDRFEFKTDSICVGHGLGYQLLSWSENVRKKMNTINWRGPDYAGRPQDIERYMNPSTILQQIEKHARYPLE